MDKAMFFFPEAVLTKKPDQLCLGWSARRARYRGLP